MQCQTCGGHAPETNYKCPHCGAILKHLEVSDFVSPPKKKFNIPVHLMVIVGLLVLAGLIMGTFFMNKVTHTVDNFVRDLLGSPRGNKTEMTPSADEADHNASGVGSSEHKNNLRRPPGNEGNEGNKSNANNDYAHVSYTPGMEVDLSQWKTVSNITIFNFYSDFHPPCEKMTLQLEALTAQYRHIEVIRIDTNREGTKGIDWGAPVMKQFNVRALPFIVVRRGDKYYSYNGNAAFHKVNLLQYGDESL